MQKYNAKIHILQDIKAEEMPSLQVQQKNTDTRNKKNLPTTPETKNSTITTSQYETMKYLITFNLNR